MMPLTNEEYTIFINNSTYGKSPETALVISLNLIAQKLHDIYLTLYKINKNISKEVENER